MNKKHFGWIVFTLFIGLALTSCQPEDSDDVNQDRIYTVYELFYNSNTDKTVAVARFRFGNATGTLLELKSPAYVLFDGDTLGYSLIYNGHAKEYAGLIPSGTFVYNNTANLIRTNAVPAYEPIAFDTGTDTIVKSQAYTLTWDGTPLSANQNVGVFVGSWTWGQDALFFTNTVGANNIVMGTNQLGNLPDGPSVLYMDRTTEVAATEVTEVGGVIRGKYRANNLTVQVVP